MCRWTLLICFACLSCAGCIAYSLPLLSNLGTVPSLTVSVEARPALRRESNEQLLERAAAALAKGEEETAATLLEQYVENEPRHLFIHAQLAELYFKQKKWEPSRQRFQDCIALSQELGEPAYAYLIHAHSRLVDIAEAEQDAFAEHLHRGIGLYELACHRARTDEASQEPSVTTILGRAALSLQDARNENPGAARPHWYLHLVWSRLGQRMAAKQALLQADDRKFFAELTAKEKHELQMARWQEVTTCAGIGGARGVR